ncbi:MAG TPA: SRPBCC domain-containing protein [Candidatus Bathyarchaeia archaeon]|nr:SRPBCC domain-containing protein [Candidatus Bathyarchaeia archaeon]
MTHSGTFVVARKAEEVFALLATPERFAPLLPDFESMAMQDATHFTLRTVIAVGQIRGHANLAMELIESQPHSRTAYDGMGAIAGGQLSLAIRFQIVPEGELTEVYWQGEVTLQGPLAILAGNLVESMGRQNIELMALRLQQHLAAQAPQTPVEPTAGASAASPEYEI